MKNKRKKTSESVFDDKLLYYHNRWNDRLRLMLVLDLPL